MARRWRGTKVRSIRVFTTAEDGRMQEIRRYKGKKRKRKVSKWNKSLDKGQRRLFKAVELYGKEGRRRQGKANRKRRDGFLSDGPTIQNKAMRKAWKQIRKISY